MCTMSYMCCHKSHAVKRQANVWEKKRKGHTFTTLPQIKTIKIIKILENLLKFTRECAVSTVLTITTTKTFTLTVHSTMCDHSCNFCRPSHASFGTSTTVLQSNLFVFVTLLPSGHVKRADYRLAIPASGACHFVLCRVDLKLTRRRFSFLLLLPPTWWLLRAALWHTYKHVYKYIFTFTFHYPTQTSSSRNWNVIKFALYSLRRETERITRSWSRFTIILQ